MGESGLPRQIWSVADDL